MDEESMGQETTENLVQRNTYKELKKYLEMSNLHSEQLFYLRNRWEDVVRERSMGSCYCL